jgi:DNA-binding response OmpR family regulator
MKILLVEDESDLGASIQRKLHQEKYIVDWVQDGNEAWCCLDSNWNEYVLAIFDWLLPGISGVELCRRIRSRGNSLLILMLTAKDSMDDKVIGLDAGADDYLTKPFGMVELLARLRALQRRSPNFQSSELRVGNLILDYAKYAVCCESNDGSKIIISLTKKEFHLMEYFMKRPNIIVTRDQILNHLYSFSTERVSNVIAAQVRLLRRKLAEYNCDRLIETIPSMGYRFNPNDTNNSQS